MRFVNLTEHKIVLQLGEKTLEVQPSGMVARATSVPQTEETLEVSGLQVRCKSKPSFAGVTGFPATPEEETLYLVSMAVGSACEGVLGEEWRGRIVGPDTGKDAIREAGQVVAVRGVQRYF